MHHCLEIWEILLAIFDYLSSTEPSNTDVPINADLTSIARTCRHFYDPAMDILWHTLGDLSPLFQCLPKSIWYKDVKCNPSFSTTILVSSLTYLCENRFLKTNHSPYGVVLPRLNGPLLLSTLTVLKYSTVKLATRTSHGAMCGAISSGGFLKKPLKNSSRIASLEGALIQCNQRSYSQTLMGSIGYGISWARIGYRVSHTSREHR